MKKIISVIIALSVISCGFTACGPQQQSEPGELEVTGITLSDDGVLVGGEAASTDPESAVYVSNDIVFYLENQGSGYGEGTADEEHSQQEADRHTVINITQPGHYMVSGSISRGQIAVNLGDDAKKDPDAVVNIRLGNADITCTVAPAIICYNAYECGSSDTETATKDVDTSAAGFNIIIEDGSVNNISGSHVAKIYEPGTTDKLHKYDAAVESLVSFNIYGNDGILNLESDNEGIETKLHMTVNGGKININSRDDALNAGEDGVSVITVNGGQILANANNGAEGDGIDSNGWLVVNDGCVSAFASEKSMDSGLDSDNGIYINGGTVLATGFMYDRISSESSQTFMVLNMDMRMYSEDYMVLKSSAGAAAAGFKSTADYKVMVYSSPLLTEDDYTICKAESITGESVNGLFANITETTGETQLAHTGGNNGMGPGKGGEMPVKPDGEMPQGVRPQIGEGAEMKDFTPPQGFGKADPSQGFKDNMPRWDITPDENGRPIGFGGEGESDFSDTPRRTATEPVFSIKTGGNMFSGVARYTAIEPAA